MATGRLASVLWPLGPQSWGPGIWDPASPTTGPQSLHEAGPCSQMGWEEPCLPACPQKSGLPQQRRAHRLYSGTPRAYISGDHNSMRLEINHNCFQLKFLKNTEHTNMCIQNNMLLNNQWVTKNIKGKI